MDKKVIGIEVLPTETPAPSKKKHEEGASEISERFREIMKKYKYNWRLDMLSKAKHFTPKLDPSTLYGPPNYYVHPSVRKYECTMRIDHLARPHLRTLMSNKRLFRKKKFQKKMREYIASSWNSIYNYYRKSELDLKKKRSLRSLRSLKSQKSTTSSKSDKQRAEWVAKWLASIATPKKVHKPDPLPPRKHAPLEDLVDSVNALATPKSDFGYLGPRVVPIPLTEATLKYQMTDKLFELASAIPKRYKMKPLPPLPAVRRAALKYEITEHTLKLAVPRDKAKAKESDLKEDPFTISPNALKYKATARIQELAQPIDRK